MIRSQTRPTYQSLTGAVDVRDRSADPNNINDSTAGFQAAATEGVVAIPPGTYTLTDKIALPNGTGAVVRGAGETKTILRVPSTFNLSATGLFESTGEPGPDLSGFSIEYIQPDTAVRGNLVAYPPAFNFPACPRFQLSEIRISRGMTGVSMIGNSGGAYIENFEASCFNKSIDVDGALDTVRLDEIHMWPFGLTANQASILADASTVGIALGRCDGIDLGSVLGLSIRKTVRLYTSASGTTFGETARLKLDHNSGLHIESGELEVVAAYSSLGETSGRSIVHTGGHLQVGVMRQSIDAALTGPAISSAVASGSGSLAISNLRSASAAHDVTHWRVEQSGGGAAQFKLLGAHIERAPNVAYSAPSLYVVDGRGDLIGITTTDKGTGGGTLLQIDTDNHWVVAGIRPVGWTVTLPASVTTGVVLGGAGIPTIRQLPTSSAGLPTGAEWSDSGTVKVA